MADENPSDPILAEAAEWSVDPELLRKYRHLPEEQLREALRRAKAEHLAVRAAIGLQGHQAKEEAFIRALSPGQRERLKERL